MTERILLALVCSLLTGCAQVPKESITLSQTMGRDLQELQRAHLSLVDQLYDRLEREVVRYVDGVYVPFQVQKTLGDPKLGGQLMQSIKGAAEPGSTPAQRTQALNFIGVYFQEVQAEAIAYRNLKLEPLKAQRDAIKSSLNSTYSNLYVANSALTGYLASVVQVRDVQNELLAKAGVPNLQNQISHKLSDATDAVRLLNQKGSNAIESLEQVKKNLEEILSPLSEK